MKNIVGSLLFATCISAHGLTVSGSDIVDLHGYNSSVYTFDQSTLTVHPDSTIAFLDGYDQSTSNILGGEISWIHLFDDSTANISGGDISWVRLYENSRANLSYANDLSWLVLADDAVAHIYAESFNYSNGRLSGVWNNGELFSFWAVNDLVLSGGSIGSVLPKNLFIHTEASVPEPSSLALLLCGLVSLVFQRNIVKRLTGGRLLTPRSA